MSASWVSWHLRCMSHITLYHKKLIWILTRKLTELVAIHTIFLLYFKLHQKLIINSMNRQLEETYKAKTWSHLTQSRSFFSLFTDWRHIYSTFSSFYFSTVLWNPYSFDTNRQILINWQLSALRAKFYLLYMIEVEYVHFFSIDDGEKVNIYCDIEVCPDILHIKNTK